MHFAVGFVLLFRYYHRSDGRSVFQRHGERHVGTNSAKSLTIHYERFGRRETESRMQFTFPVKTAGHFTLSITSERSDVYEPGSVWPQPDRMYSRGKTLYFVYDTLQNSDRFSVLYFTTPTRAGKWNTVIRANNEPEITVWQFIYP